jgi:hypothetical protein
MSGAFLRSLLLVSALGVSTFAEAPDMSSAYLCGPCEKGTQFLSVGERIYIREMVGGAVSYDPLGLVGYSAKNMGYGVATGLDLFAEEQNDSQSALWNMGFSYLKTSEALFLVEGTSLKAVKKDVESNGKKSVFPALDKNFSFVGRLETTQGRIDIAAQFSGDELVWLGSQNFKPVFRRSNVFYAYNESAKKSILFWHNDETLYLTFGTGRRFGTCAAPKTGEISDMIMSPPTTGDEEVAEASRGEVETVVPSSEDVKKK